MRRVSAAAVATLAACAVWCGVSGSAHALLGGTDALTSKPGVTAEETLKLTPQRQNEIIAKTVRKGSFVSRGVCSPGTARFLARRADGAGIWKMACSDAEAQLVVMPVSPQGQAMVLSCRRSKALLKVDCGTAPARRVGR